MFEFVKNLIRRKSAPASQELARSKNCEKCFTSDPPYYRAVLEIYSTITPSAAPVVVSKGHKLCRACAEKETVDTLLTGVERPLIESAFRARNLGEVHYPSSKVIWHPVTD